MIAAPSPSLTRQQRADDTRRRLFAAAVQLFTSAGYHGTTVEAIARRAGVAKGTFFVHFPTKDAVILELVSVQTEAARAARTAALGEGPRAALQATAMTLGQHAGLSRELSRAVLAATLASQPLADAAGALFEQVLDLMIGDARALLDGRDLRPTVRGRGEPHRHAVAAERLARALMAAYLGAAYHFAANPGSPPMRELLEPLVATLLDLDQEPSHASSLAIAPHPVALPAAPPPRPARGRAGRARKR